MWAMPSVSVAASQRCPRTRVTAAGTPQSPDRKKGLGFRVVLGCVLFFAVVQGVVFVFYREGLWERSTLGVKEV